MELRPLSRRRLAFGWGCACGLVVLGALILGGAGRSPRIILEGVEPAPEASDDVQFGREVRPILVRSCLLCHGFDPSTREAALRLDTFDGATADRGVDGGPAIVPGDPDASLLIQRVTTADPFDRMPAKGPALTEAEIDILRRWIAQGASYEPHWSLRPVEEHEPPPAIGPNGSSRPIDAFIGAKLAEAGLEPAPRADRRTLLRRLSFDITGLPPTPEQLRDFEADESPDAYERLVDKLLALPAFGERWGRHWLDLMRYAETYGHEYDYPIRHAWQYRDYVIRALNADVPYDQFVTEHIAGDLLAQPRRHPEQGFNESIIATGFWWLSQGTHGPVDVRQDEADRIDNQIDVLAKSFLASTVSCARCHDHKFDPILTKEYYGLAGFVQSSRRQEAYLDPYGRIGSAVERLDELNDQARAILERVARSGLQTDIDSLGTYMLGAAEVLAGRPAEGEQAAIARDVVVDTFDDLTYGAWTVEGDAFTDRPSDAGPDALAGEGTARGAGFANTHRRLEGEGSAEADSRVGRLIGTPFVIEHDYLHFLIGGGNHPGKTGLRLLVDGKAVRDATGINSLRMEARRFDIAGFRGQEATIEIFDQVAGGWGNIRVDDIVLSDEPDRQNPARRSIESVAAESDLDAARLADWVRLLQRADAGDPAFAILSAARSVESEPDAVVMPPANGVAPKAQPAPHESFDDPRSFDRWFVSGWAFGDRPVEPGEWVAPGVGMRLAQVAAADSGVRSAKLMGTMRSPTFEITTAYIAVRARGRGTTRVIIDGYTLDEYNALLFDRCKLDIDAPDWSWHVHDVHKYGGHRAHFEIIDDRGDSSISVDEIVFVDEDRPPPTPTWSETIHARAGTDTTLARLADTCRQAAMAALDGDDDALGISLLNELIDAGIWQPASEELQTIFSESARVSSDCPSPMRAMAMEDGTGEDEYVFIRGSHKSRGPVAPRAFIDVMCDDPHLDIPSGSGRLQLANKLLDESDPLPPRVIVNRVWKHLFGRGIVETTDDFGLLGQAPTHPELLDHLAYRFRHEMGWSVKTLIREIVLSETYRMASRPLSERAAQIDPLNHLWSVREPVRLEGEAIRDAVLAVSGRLDSTMYGASVPMHLSPFLTGRGRPGRSGPVDGDGRRSIYLEVRRNFLDPMMQTFDAPNAHSTMGKRSVSNVPAQSLILLNAPFVGDQAELLAKRTFDDAQQADGRLDRLYMLSLARVPSPDERAAAFEFLKEQSAARHPDDPQPWQDDLLAWTDLAHVVFNLKEFAFIE
jgi:hypothetical protein